MTEKQEKAQDENRKSASTKVGKAQFKLLLIILHIGRVRANSDKLEKNEQK